MSDDLLPCPFCGNAPETGDYGHSVRAICRNCGFDMPVDGWQDRVTPPEERTRDAEFMAWARRHAPTQLAELITRRAQMSQNGNDRSQPQNETEG